MWRVDQAQRLLERAAAVLVDRDSLAPLLDHVRRRYRVLIDGAQDAFLDAVARTGWPAEGYARQTQAWSRHAQGAVREGRRTAWFLVDALRYEMGRELAEGLAREGTVKIEPACGVVPAATPFGMAALLPGAEAGLAYGEREGALVPVLGSRAVMTAEERREVLRAALGDRFDSLRLGELLTSSSRELSARLRATGLLAVFSTEIDDLGEHSDPLIARRCMSEVVADLLAATSRLVEHGFERLVFVADHGFILLPEILPGDRCVEPAGRWLLRKRRALLGTLGGRGGDVVTLGAAALGIQGPVEHVCVPRGVRVFRAGSPYFHEGISLQECVVPLVVLDAVRRQPDPEGTALVKVEYRSDRFTTRIFSVQVSYSSILRAQMSVRVQAFTPGTGDVVGEAADCEARDPHTGLVTLATGRRVHVPIALGPDFHGDAVEVRATDATTPGRVHASLVLRNAILE
ncbi:MAG: PglZ domain-containing protein [Deltaproteobacteria bacterium]|nr:PglZ domain-containing protein [Deltaproteobacteria bacterium]